jgi:protein-arginine kinase activator protein McsA
MSAASVELNDDPNDPLQEVVNPINKPKTTETEREYTKMTLEQLHTMLDAAINVEDYATAARIRDEIQRREK